MIEGAMVFSSILWFEKKIWHKFFSRILAKFIDFCTQKKNNLLKTFVASW